MVNFWVFLLICFVSLTASRATGSVILIGNNRTLSFEDIEANFGELACFLPKLLFVFIFLCNEMCD